MIYTIEELRQKIFQHVYEVYDVFKNFFDEEHVDLQGIPPDNYLLPNGISMEELPDYDISDECFQGLFCRYESNKFYIFIWWPNVTVTNEYNKSVEIQDLYAKVPISIHGAIPYEEHGFQLTRCTFSALQYNSGYIHSHVPKMHGTPEFQNPCFGSGPISRTINNLKVSADEASWMLFCQELSLYVTVESISGVPYFRMENIGDASPLSDCEDNLHQQHTDSKGAEIIETCQPFKMILKEFLQYYLESGTLTFGFFNGKYVCGLSFYDFILGISNAFISWFNLNGSEALKDILFDAGILMPCLIKEGKLYKVRREVTVYHNRNENVRLFSFKGHDVNLRVDTSNSDELSLSTILNPNVSRYILGNILKTINYRYAKHDSESGSNQQASPISQNAVHL